MTRTLFLCLLFTAPASAAGPEIREYRISVDGKPAGTYTMTIDRRDDGTVEQTGRADVSLRVLIKTFSYSYRGKETWRDGRLVRLESQTNDDGKQFQVQGEATSTGLQIRANGRANAVPADAWTMSYWQLPPKDRRGGEITLLDTDTGRVLRGRIRSLGPTVIGVAGAPTQVTRYQIAGGAQADLWYDAADRLVRQETSEDGHRTTLELIRVAR